METTNVGLALRRRQSSRALIGGTEVAAASWGGCRPVGLDAVRLEVTNPAPRGRRAASMVRLVSVVLTCACVGGAVIAPGLAMSTPTHPVRASVANATWGPKALAKRAVRADLSRWAHGFKSFLNSGPCSGTNSIQHCLVTGSVSNDNVRAHVTLKRTHGNVHYSDRVSLTAGMGGGTISRTFSGKI